MAKKSNKQLKEYFLSKGIKTSQDFQKHVKFPETGLTGYSFSAPFLFIKYVIKNNDYDVYEREKYISNKLNKFDWCPKLLFADDNNKILIFRNAGVTVTKENKPKDLEKQFKKILNDMKSLNIKHNDIKTGEILVNEKKKIFLCDFGWATINDKLGCGIGIYNGQKKSGRIRSDHDALKRLKLID